MWCWKTSCISALRRLNGSPVDEATKTNSVIQLLPHFALYVYGHNGYDVHCRSFVFLRGTSGAVRVFFSRVRESLLERQLEDLHLQRSTDHFPHLLVWHLELGSNTFLLPCPASFRCRCWGGHKRLKNALSILNRRRNPLGDFQCPHVIGFHRKLISSLRRWNAFDVCTTLMFNELHNCKNRLHAKKRHLTGSTSAGRLSNYRASAGCA